MTSNKGPQTEKQQECIPSYAYLKRLKDQDKKILTGM